MDGMVTTGYCRVGQERPQESKVVQDRVMDVGAEVKSATIL